MECPVTYCAHKPFVTWCKYSGRNCLPLEIGPRQHTGWEDQDQVSVFTLHFEPVHPSDDGWYSCSIDFNSEVMDSNIITLHVTERTQNDSEYHLITVSDIPGATNASGPPTMEERASRTWLLYSLLPLVALLLLLACFCLVSFLKRHQDGLQFPSALMCHTLGICFPALMDFLAFFFFFFLDNDSWGTTGFHWKTECIMVRHTHHNPRLALL
ncbi:B- and T-lymphocyte attenuator [Lemmus lemmus]